MNPIHLVIRLYGGLGSRIRNVWFRALGMQLSGYVWMRKISIPRQWSDISVGEGAAFDDGVVLLCSGPPRQGKLTIGSRTYINRYTILDASERIAIGTNCMIGPYCYITDHDHGIEVNALINEQQLVSSPVIIGNDVWVGAGVVMLKGVKIGDGAVIGAGSVVTKEVAPRVIVVGNPARQIRERK